jgi:mono/diheme cytochrome c family protein
MDNMINSGQMSKRRGLGILLGSLLVLGVACGGGGTDDSASGNTAVEAVVPTMPSARFTAVSSQSVLTATVAVAANAGATTTVTTTVAGADNSTPVNQDLERGARSYARNNCASCHGEQGEGVADKGAAITAMTLTLPEFDTLLRTGGGLGAEHIFGPSAISPGGMATLYAYVQSLGQ